MNQIWQMVESSSSAWTDHLWRATWQGALAIAVVWFIAAWWRSLSPRVVCWAWRLVCLKLLALMFWVQAIEVPVLPPRPAEPLNLASIETISTTPPAPPEPAAPIAVDHLVTSAETPPVSINFRTVLVLAWLFGVGVFIILTIRECLFARRLYRSSRPVSDALLSQLCNSETDRLAVRRQPEIRLAPLNGPMLVGIRHPAILLPENALTQFDASELRLMLAHELAHQMRRDLVWNWLPAAVGWLLFFHPLVWLLKRGWFESQEAACDELLIQTNVARPSQYGRLLVKLTTLWPQGERFGLAGAGVLGTYRSLERRIVAMTHVRSLSRRRLVIVASLLALVACVAIVPWQLVAQEPPATKADPAKSDTNESDTSKANEKSKKKSAKTTKNTAGPNIIIAEHVLLWEGKEVVTWDEVVARLRKLRPAGPIHAQFYSTNAISHRTEGENWQFWHDRIMKLYRELFEPAGVSFGSISPLNGGKFDAIRTADDLIPDPQLARSGRVLTPDNKPAANAQVVILPTTGVNDISLNGTRLRDRFNEDWLPANDAGEFVIHPREKEYLVVALHSSGFLLQHGSDKDDKLLKLDLHLLPWATVAIASTDKTAKQDATIYAYPQGRDNHWPYFSIHEIEVKDKTIEFKVPPGAIAVSRSFKLEQGASRSVPAETFELEAGEHRDVAIHPATEAERKAMLGDFLQIPEVGAPNRKVELKPNVEKKNKPAPAKPNDDPVVKAHEKRWGVKVENHPITVTGKATDVDGKAIEGATVYLVSTGSSPAKTLGKVTTDQNGAYEFRNVELGLASRPGDRNSKPFGTFEVFGRAPGFAFAWQEMKHVALQPQHGAFVVGEEMETRLRFVPANKIAGRFVDEKGTPIRGAKIVLGHCDYISGPDNNQSTENAREFWAMNQAIELMADLLQATSDADGRFEFKEVPPDVMAWLSISHPDYGDRTIYASTSETPPKTYDDGHPVEPLPINMTLHKARTVTVEVKFADTDKPAIGIRVHAGKKRATGSAAYGTSDKSGKLTFKLPPGEYSLMGDPIDGMDYVRSSQPLVVKTEPAEQIATLKIDPACVLILKAVDADTGKGIPEVSFWYEKDGEPGSRWGVQRNTWWVDNPLSNEHGELRSAAKPGKRRYGVAFGPLPDGYRAIDPVDERKGRELELPAGKSVTVEFKLRKKPK